MWILLVLWANGFVTTFTGIESEAECLEVNKLLRQQIWQPEMLNPDWACIEDSSQ